MTLQKSIGQKRQDKIEATKMMGQKNDRTKYNLTKTKEKKVCDKKRRDKK